MARKQPLWSTLSKRTKERYKRLGVTPQAYNSGKLDPELKRIVHGKSSVEILRAKQQGLGKIVPGFDRLGIADKKRLADAYREGLVKPRNPLTGRRNAFGLPETERVYTPRLHDRRHPVEVRIDPETGFETYWGINPTSGKHEQLNSFGHPMRSTDTMNAEMDWADILEDLGLDIPNSDMYPDERRSALEASSG